MVSVLPFCVAVFIAVCFRERCDTDANVACITGAWALRRRNNGPLNVTNNLCVHTSGCVSISRPCFVTSPGDSSCSTGSGTEAAFRIQGILPQQEGGISVTRDGTTYFRASPGLTFKVSTEQYSQSRIFATPWHDPELGTQDDSDVSEASDDDYDSSYESEDVLDSDYDEAEGGSEAVGRFGTPRLLASGSNALEAAKSRFSNLFGWGQEEENVGEDGDGDASWDQEDPENAEVVPQPYRSTRPYGERDILELPYVESRNVNMSFDRWPDNCFLRIRLESYYPYLLRLSADRLIQGIREHTNLRVGNVKAMPMRRKRWCLLSSPHVDKRSKDLFEIQQHVRFLDVFPAVKPRSQTENSSETDNGEVTDGAEIMPKEDQANDSRWRITQHSSTETDDGMKFKGLLMVPLPSLVSFDYWFEEAHKPVKNQAIEKVFRRRVWVSKYFLHHYEKREKAEIIDQLTSPELYPEIPLRWKKHPCDYFALQLGELRKIHNFVVARKAEDEARARYGVAVPKFYDIDEVRFVPNDDDRRCGYISSDDDDDEAEIAKEMAEIDNTQSGGSLRR
ncbi:ribosomal protein S10 [Babesia caballi]|uniref:Ribosomal protein S10 n=1 Tax=Babesia caballi TaxID=5871 RepID=A0AAV4LLY7_BABCB|nr:ribosomal protein S10 [Babesia caballi]